jgi:hypothetical protein
VRKLILLCALACALTGGVRHSLAVQPSLVPLPTFGGGDGWLAPGDRTYLTTDSTQRGLAYNRVTGNLLVVNRSGSVSVNVLSGATGANVGTLQIASFMTGPGSGIFPINMIAAADDGAIYACNLADNSTAQFRIYQWENESASPTLGFNNDFSNAPRVGDTLDVRGSGNDTRILAGLQSGSAASANNKGYVIISTDGGAPYSGSARTFTTTPPNEGDHRLGITFAEGDTVIGTQGGMQSPTQIRSGVYSSFATVPSTYLGGVPLTTAGERPMDFAIIDGVRVLATVDTATSIVRAYDVDDPTSPHLLAQGTTIGGSSNANPNSVGQVRFGPITGSSATLYALNTNNGIQAFTLTVPEPASVSIVSVSSIGLIRRPRRCRPNKCKSFHTARLQAGVK